MDIIYRPKYLSKIKKFIDKPIIKVLTGMRRVGKSTILEIIRDDILAHIPPENKIFLNFESIEFSGIQDSDVLANYLKPILQNGKGKYYFFFDEIQLVKNWEQVINGLRVDIDCDIYITGSNSMLISGELATLLAGRYVEFEIQSFTFSEFIQIFESSGLSKEELFGKYIRLGGMPFLKYFDLEEESSHKYLNDVYHTVLVRDVLQYNSIREVDIFQRLLLYVMENIGHTFSANSIKNYFKSESRKVSLDTILNYLEYCNRAFIIRKAPRYDVAGKKILKVDEKYYLNDHGFRQAKGFSNTKDIERTLENIVYIELISRGYEVKIGRVKDKEIDFIAKKGDHLSYYQVSYLMGEEKTREREFGVYHEIPDHYPKYVLSMDSFDFSQNGIIHKNIMEFLLDIEER